MRRFDRRKLIFSAITTVIALIAVINVRSLQNDWHYTVLPIMLFIGFGYSNYKWTDGYLKRNPGASWRKLPRFLHDEPALNVYCLNFYKWILFVIVYGFSWMPWK